MGKRKENISHSKIRERNAEEFERLFRKYFLRLAKYAFRYVSNAAVAQDLTQSVFLKIWELNGSWNPKGTIKSYLYTAVKNQCLNHIKHKRVVEEWESVNNPDRVKRSIDTDLQQEEQAERLDHAITRAIEKMPEKRREIFKLSRDEGLTYQEIANLKGVAKKTVENHMGNALQFLKEELSEWL